MLSSWESEHLLTLTDSHWKRIYLERSGREDLLTMEPIVPSIQEFSLFSCLLKGKGYISVPEILCRYNFIRWQRIRLGDFGVRWKGPRSFALVGRVAVWLHFNPPGLPGAVTQQEANGKLSQLNGDPPDIWSEETGRRIFYNSWFILQHTSEADCSD